MFGRARALGGLIVERNGATIGRLRFEVAIGLWSHYLVRGDLEAAGSEATRPREIAGLGDDRSMRVVALLRRGDDGPLARAVRRCRARITSMSQRAGRRFWLPPVRNRPGNFATLPRGLRPGCRSYCPGPISRRRENDSTRSRMPRGPEEPIPRLLLAHILELDQARAGRPCRCRGGCERSAAPRVAAWACGITRPGDGARRNDSRVPGG